MSLQMPKETLGFESFWWCTHLAERKYKLFSEPKSIFEGIQMLLCDLSKFLWLTKSIIFLKGCKKVVSLHNCGLEQTYF